MTQIGILHLGSAVLLSLVICLAVSINEQRDPRRIARETVRRWLKFVGVAAVLGLAVWLLD